MDRPGPEMLSPDSLDGQFFCKDSMKNRPKKYDAVVDDDEGSMKYSSKKYDIFEDIDEDWLAEFEQLFQESRKASNYDAFVKPKKKGDPKKYSTMGVVQTNEKGQRTLN